MSNVLDGRFQGIEGGGAPSQAAGEDMSVSEMSDTATACVLANSTVQGPVSDSRAADETAPERRRVSLDVRLTETEREAIRRRAQRLGVKPSRWGRDVMLDALDARRSNELEAVMRTAQIEAERTAQAHADARALAAQVRPLAVNVNTLAAKALAGQAVTLSDEVSELVEVLRDVRELLGDRVAVR